MKQTIYFIIASSTSNIVSIGGPLNVAEVNIEPDNQQTHKITHPIKKDIDYESTNYKTQQTDQAS